MKTPDRIIQYLTENESGSLVSISEGTGVEKKSVSSALDAMKNRGLIEVVPTEKHKNREYRLVEMGADGIPVAKKRKGGSGVYAPRTYRQQIAFEGLGSSETFRPVPAPCFVNRLERTKPHKVDHD